MTELNSATVEPGTWSWGAMPEQNRRARGHEFYPPFADLAKIPELYATEGQPVDQKICHLHYFTGGSDWYIAEVDPASGLAFGWARVNYSEGEWGYIHLVELEELYLTPAVRPGSVALPILVERDLHFAPTRAADIPAIAS
ncbi:DUF2958 domain-containing protein [Streptomyces rubellomurinus]|uniref:DUF2958 domain-containing protein n=1 Tax=Streptomyces rubellomurinus (strain ATCC 31215) TaxID=359131 RepID=UPI0006987C52|nr:DUF2958 domain-containing protein [Streptomyces rubellomurinus]